MMGYKKKIIFLDVDGVLNTPESMEGLEDRCMEQLARIVRESGAQIVMTSSWKHFFDKKGQDYHKEYCVETRDYVWKKFARFGMEIRDYTEHIGGDRYTEIRKWLRRHPFTERYIVIDDSMFPGFEKLGDRLILCTDPDTGLTEELSDRAIRVLRAEK